MSKIICSDIMALQSDWEKGMFLKWCTEMPFENRPRQSPTFIIQNIEFYFLFTRSFNDKHYYYYLYLKPSVGRLNVEPFSFMIYSDSQKSGTFTASGARYFSSKNSIKSFRISETRHSNRALNFNSGCCINFYFIFQSERGPVLTSKPRNGKFLLCIFHVINIFQKNV